MSTDMQPASTGNALELRPHERYMRNLQARMQEEAGNRSFDVAANQMDKILTAETESEIWEADEGGTVSGKDFTDVPIQINSYTKAPSRDEFDAPLGCFVSISATLLTESKGYSAGEEVIISTGAPLIITKLDALAAGGYIPCKCMIVGTKANKGEVLKLRPLAGHFMTTTPTAD